MFLSILYTIWYDNSVVTKATSCFPCIWDNNVDILVFFFMFDESVVFSVDLNCCNSILRCTFIVQRVNIEWLKIDTDHMDKSSTCEKLAAGCIQFKCLKLLVMVFEEINESFIPWISSWWIITANATIGAQ